MASTDDWIERVGLRIEALERSLEILESDGVEDDSYNTGFIEGAIYELKRLILRHGDTSWAANSVQLEDDR